MMNNRRDPGVHFSQGVEFILSAGRLGKKAWMLQYDNSSHTAVGIDAVDYTSRIMQFFDHYLKGAPAPQWMEKGISASEKTYKIGLDVGRTKF